jgi:hypothetical protein
MTVVEHAASGLLKDRLLEKLPGTSPATPTFSLLQIQRIQILMDPAREHILSDDEAILPGKGQGFEDAPPPHR